MYPTISPSGIFDDFGAARFSPDEFLPFCGDTVLFAEPDRRRAWTAGGDRPSWLDRYGVWSGQTVRRHIGVSHFGQRALTGDIRLHGHLGDASGQIVVDEAIAVGDVRELGPPTLSAPIVDAPTALTLHVALTVDAQTVAANAWPVWVFPAPPAASEHRVGLYDPTGTLADFEKATVIVATAWRPELAEFVRAGGKLLYLQPAAAPDASAPDAFASALGTEARITPLLTRVDARTSAVHLYLCAAARGDGQLLATTLRPYGGLGDQPSGLGRAVCGAYLLRLWLAYLVNR